MTDCPDRSPRNPRARTMAVGSAPADRSPRRCSRRAVLGGTGAALAATVGGCTAPGGSTGELQGDAELPTATLRMAPVDDAALPRKVLYTVGVDGPDRRADLMDDILDGGTTVERTRPPFPKAVHIYYDGAVYELSREVVERTPATGYHVRVDIVQGTVTDSTAVDFADLPAVDREKFVAYGWDDGGTFGFGTTILYTDAERERSALVPKSAYDYIVWEDGSEAAWFVDGSHETTLNTYEYAGERVATATEYGRRMREQQGFELAGLPDAEADIVRTAVEAGRYVVGHGNTPSPAFRSLADRFRGREQAHGLDEAGEGDLSGPYVVRYDGAVYWTVLHVDRTTPATGSPA